MGWGPIPAANRTLKTQFAGERERVRRSNMPWLAAATLGQTRQSTGRQPDSDLRYSRLAAMAARRERTVVVIVR